MGSSTRVFVYLSTASTVLVLLLSAVLLLDRQSTFPSTLYVFVKYLALSQELEKLLCVYCVMT